MATTRNTNGTLLKIILPLVMVVFGGLLAWYAWRGGTTARLSTIERRVGHCEEYVDELPKSYMPRAEIKAELQTIQVQQQALDSKVDMIDEHTREMLMILRNGG